MRAAAIVNVRSSRADRHLNELRALIEARGIELDDFEVIDSHVQVEKRVRRAVKRGARLVIVGGGDGTMMLAVNALAHRKAALGVLPLGTGNSFAATLGIGTDLDAALDVIARRHEARVDLGVMNDRYFANFATIGLPAEIAAAAPHDLKRVIGSAAYAAGGIKAFLTHRPFRAKIRWDDGDMRLRTQHMVIASGRLFGKQPVTPDATITDGKLAFFTTSGTSQFDIARMYLAFGMGLQTRLPDAQSFSSRKITVKASPKQPVNLDGDACGTTPARFSIARRALRVRVPANFLDASH